MMDTSVLDTRCTGSRLRVLSYSLFCLLVSFFCYFVKGGDVGQRLLARSYVGERPYRATILYVLLRIKEVLLLIPAPRLWHAHTITKPGN